MHLLLQLEMQRLLEKLSHPARYQILIYVVFGLNLMPVAFHHLFMLVAARETLHWCVVGMIYILWGKTGWVGGTSFSYMALY
jgi:hypothetical protein